jgi:hypothetical protein
MGTSKVFLRWGWQLLQRRKQMRRLVIAFAALAALGIALPFVSSAQAEDSKIIIKKDGDHDKDIRRHHKKIVVIKHRHRHRDHDHDHD